MKYDTTLKELLKEVPKKLLSVLTGQDAELAEVLNVEFPQVSAKRADFVLRLVDEQIYHLELQTNDSEEMDWRMLEYFLLLYKQYKVVPIQQVLYIGNKSITRTIGISLSNLQFTYQLIDIRQIDEEILLQSELLTDNILAILCKVQSLKEKKKKLLVKIAELPKSNRADFLTKLFILTGLRGWKVLALQEVKSMSITFDIEENEFLADIFHQGEQKGRLEGEQKGRLEGEQKGRLEGEAIILQRQLERKFGPLPQDLLDKLHKADFATLELWSLRILDVNSLDGIFS